MPRITRAAARALEAAQDQSNVPQTGEDDKRDQVGDSDASSPTEEPDQGVRQTRSRQKKNKQQPQHSQPQNEPQSSNEGNEQETTASKDCLVEDAPERDIMEEGHGRKSPQEIGKWQHPGRLTFGNIPGSYDQYNIRNGPGC